MTRSLCLLLAMLLAGAILSPAGAAGQSVTVVVKKNSGTGVPDIKITVGQESKLTGPTGRVVINRRCDPTDLYTAQPKILGTWYVSPPEMNCASGHVIFKAARPT